MEVLNSELLVLALTFLLKRVINEEILALATREIQIAHSIRCPKYLERLFGVTFSKGRFRKKLTSFGRIQNPIIVGYNPFRGQTGRKSLKRTRPWRSD